MYGIKYVACASRSVLRLCSLTGSDGQHFRFTVHSTVDLQHSASKYWNRFFWTTHPTTYSWVNGCVIQKRKKHFYRMMTQVGQAVVQTSTDFVFPKDNFWETRNWLFFQLSDSSIKSFEVLIIWLIDFEVFHNFFILFSTTFLRWVFLKIQVRSLAKGHT